MSYSLHFWRATAELPTPRTVVEVAAMVDRLSEISPGRGANFDELTSVLAARFPEEEEDEFSFWADWPLDGQSDSQAPGAMNEH